VNANISTITDHKDASYNQVMGYDGLDRLTSASGKWGSSTSFIYDTLGNITSKNLGSMAVSYNYDPTTKRLNSANVTGSKTKAYNFTYDTKGAVTHNGMISLPRNQAGQGTHATGNHAYIYDGNGKRVKDDKNNTARYSIYDLTGKMVYQWDRSTETITDYIFLGSEMIVEAQVGMGNGSQNVNNTNVGYTGHQWDNDTGLNYMQARYYDPLIGRFYSNDPVGFTGEVDTFNRYSYVANNPYRYTDPTGEHKSDGDSGLALGQLIRDIFRNPDDYVPKRRKSNSQSTGKKSVRKELYPTRARKSVQNKMIADATNANGDVVCNECKKATKQPTMQHDPALVTTHNAKGYNTDQKTRNQLYNDTITEVNCKQCQSKEGGATQERYRTDKGPNYKPRKSRKKR
jgi:RHS repeat-associated protein